MKYGKSVYRALTTITQFSIHMLVPICGCSVLGFYLDKWLGTKFIIIILFFCGAAAGFRNIYIMAKMIYEKSEKRERNDKKNKTVK